VVNITHKDFVKDWKNLGKGTSHLHTVKYRSV